MANFSQAGVIFVARGVDRFIRTFDSANSSLEKFNRRVGNAASSVSRLETQINRFTNFALAGLLAGIVAVTAAFGGLVTIGVSTAASFEDAFAGVTKTVDAFIDRAASAEAGVITLTEAGREFRQALVGLSGEIPVTFERLSAIAGLGGQLGIVEGLAGDEAREALLRFTETVAGLAEATNLTQEKAATGLAQISNIFRETVTDIGLNIEQLGSTIVELGNTSAATESLILNFSQRIAGAGQTIGLTQAEVLGIGTAFASIGITAEAGATSVNRALLIMNEAVSNSTDKFLDNTTAINNTIEEISDLQADLVRLEAQTGITGESLVNQRDAFLEAGNAAQDFGRQLGDARREQLFQTQVEINRLIQSLNQLKTTQGTALTTEVFDELLRVVQQTEKGMDQTAESFRELFREDPAEAFALFVEGLAEEGERAGETLDRIGLGSVEATRAFLAIAGASDLVRDRILAANEAFEANQALADEVSVRYATLRSNFQEFINVVRGITDQLFSPLIGPLNTLIDIGKDVVEVLGKGIPDVITALVNKFGPELREAFDEIFGPTGLFAGGEITTPEGFAISGEAIGVEPGFITNLKNQFQSLADTINALDVSGLSDQIIAISDTITTTWNSAMLFAAEHADILRGAVTGLAIVLGGTVLSGALIKVSALIAALASPLGLLSVAVVGLSVAWETNFLNIQEVTTNALDKIKGTFENFISEIQALNIGEIFDDLFAGGEITTPEGFMVSGEAIGLDTSGLIDFTAAAEKALEAIGTLVDFVIQVPLDQIAGLAEMFKGFAMILDGVIDGTLTLEISLSSLQSVIGGFVDAVTAPLRNLAELLGFGEIDLSFIETGIVGALGDFIDGFLRAFTGTGIDEAIQTFSGLLESLQNLGESGALTVFIAGLTQMGEGLEDLFTSIGILADALKELVGLQPDDSLFTFFGQIAGFVATVGIDQLINVVEALTGFVDTLTGLANLDFTQTVEGLTGLTTALLSVPIDTAQRIGEIFGTDVKLTLAQGVLDLIAALQENMDEGFISLDMGRAIGEWVTKTIAQFTEGINTIIDQVQALFAINIDLDFQALDDQITEIIDRISVRFAQFAFGGFVTADQAFTTFIDDISLRLFEAVSGIWTDIDLGIPTAHEFGSFLIDLPQQLKDTISGVWDGVDLGIPSFQSVLDKAKEVADSIKGFFIGLFEDLSFELPDFDLGILEKLADLGLIDLEVEAPDTEGLGTDLAEGLVEEVEVAEETWRDAWLDFLLAPIEAGKEALGVQSPSTLTEDIGRDVIEGYALGLSDLTPIEQALIGVNDLILRAFTNLNTQLASQTVPVLQRVQNEFTTLYSDTLPRTTSALVDDLIPAKIELFEVNENDLIPSVESLITAEEELADTLGKVKSKLDRLISLKEKATNRAKALTKEVDKLAKAYLSLAAAVTAAAEAGDGLTAPPATGPAGPEFQSGGMFVVPSSVGPEGMPIRVHANELVQIIPAEFRQQIQAIPIDVIPSSVMSPQITGAPITNVISHDQSINTSETREFHLHVQEAPTADVRDSFELLESLT